MKLSRTLSLLLAGAALAAPATWAQIEQLDLPKMVTKADDAIDGTSTYDQYEVLLDQTGTAETDLRPAGKALLDGRRGAPHAEPEIPAHQTLQDRGS